jgi:hypothetical protein
VASVPLQPACYLKRRWPRYPERPHLEDKALKDLLGGRRLGQQRRGALHLELIADVLCGAGASRDSGMHGAGGVQAPGAHPPPAPSALMPRPQAMRTHGPHLHQLGAPLGVLDHRRKLLAALIKGGAPEGQRAQQLLDELGAQFDGLGVAGGSKGLVHRRCAACGGQPLTLPGIRPRILQHQACARKTSDDAAHVLQATQGRPRSARGRRCLAL